MMQPQQSDALPLMERMLEQVVEQNLKARSELQAKLEKQQEEFTAKMEQQWREIDRLREEAVEARVQAALAPQEAVSGQQLSALQARFEALHEAKLLSKFTSSLSLLVIPESFL